MIKLDRHDDHEMLFTENVHSLLTTTADHLARDGTNVNEIRVRLARRLEFIAEIVRGAVGAPPTAEEAKIQAGD
jgi:hypothetical protein